jgi:hypothetical protein
MQVQTKIRNIEKFQINHVLLKTASMVGSQVNDDDEQMRTNIHALSRIQTIVSVSQQSRPTPQTAQPLGPAEVWNK